MARRLERAARLLTLPRSRVTRGYLTWCGSSPRRRMRFGRALGNRRTTRSREESSADGVPVRQGHPLWFGLGGPIPGGPAPQGSGPSVGGFTHRRGLSGRVTGSGQGHLRSTQALRRAVGFRTLASGSPLTRAGRVAPAPGVGLREGGPTTPSEGPIAKPIVRGRTGLRRRAPDPPRPGESGPDYGRHLCLLDRTYLGRDAVCAGSQTPRY